MQHINHIICTHYKEKKNRERRPMAKLTIGIRKDIMAQNNLQGKLLTTRVTLTVKCVFYFYLFFQSHVK